MGYDIEGVGRSVEHLAHKVSSLTDAVTDNVKEDKESTMGDTIRGDKIADAAVARLEAFAINHYTPTRTASSGGTGA